MDFPNELFTSATIVRNASMPTHRDSFNDKNSSNLISLLRTTTGAGVWEELQPGDVFKGRFQSMEVNGKQVPGQVHLLTSPIQANPRRWHCPIQGTEGPRVLLAGHTINSWRKLTPDMREELFEHGFVLPDEEDLEAKVKALQEEAEQTRHMEYEVMEEEFIPGLESRDPAIEIDEDVRRCAKAAAENLYTRGIEKVLAELDGDLRVVHTVHPSEVEEAIEQRSKAVYTVNPPNKEGQKYRRKARIVSCGNFQPKSDNEINYSGALLRKQFDWE
eukprot:s1633_g20.t1